MGHTKPEALKDLAKEFEKIKTLGGIKEKSPGVFYWKSVPFLHFHDKDGKRWADVKTVQGEWETLEIDFAANLKGKTNFLKAIIQAHLKISG